MFSPKSNHKNSSASLILKQLTNFVVGILVLPVLVVQIAECKSLPDIQNYYERGLYEKEQGNFDEALSIWSEAINELQEPDFRISQSFIQLITQEQFHDYYTKASEIYFWGLKGAIDSYEIDALLEELENIKALISNGVFKKIKKGIEEYSTSSLGDIAQFWANIDPTPLTDYNERLIEHWQRLEYAREHFKKLNSDELDDRAHIYLKYGEPYYKKSGQLYYSSAMVARLLKEGIRPPSFASDEQHAIVITQRMNLENRIRQYHEHQNYEVWIYQGLKGKNQNIIFLFGTPNGTSSFRKLNTIDDFIPSIAYRNYLQHNYSFNSTPSSLSSSESRDDRQNVQFNNAAAGNASQVDLTPALILQLMYYQQFAALDSYFGSAFDQMMNRFINTANSIDSGFKGLAREFGTLYGNKLIVLQSKAPNEKSGLSDNLVDMPVDYYEYRFLDSNGEPYSKMFARISFSEAIYYDLLKETNSLQTSTSLKYKMTSGYKIMSSTGDAIESIREDRLLESLDPVYLSLDVPYLDEDFKTILSHELHKADALDSTSVSSSSPFPVSLKGLSNRVLELGASLKNNELVLSDLIIGYFSDDQENSVSKEDSIDFAIAHDKSIPRGSELSFYYELYNLQPRGTEDISEYRFQYSIVKKNKGLFKKDQDPLISIDIINTAFGPTDKNIITIDTSEQQRGDYELSILIRDTNSGLTFSTTEVFSIN